MPARTESTASRHIFRFQRLDGLTEQAPVFINGMLDGFLEADNTGRAEAIAIIELYTAAEELLDRVEYIAFVDSTAHNNTHVTDVVNDRFGINTTLIPGNVYELRTELRLTADPRGIGSAHADFNNTFEVSLSGTPIPQPFTLALLATSLPLALRTRRSTTPPTNP